jgi:hypothetical protein
MLRRYSLLPVAESQPATARDSAFDAHLQCVNEGGHDELSCSSSNPFLMASDLLSMLWSAEQGWWCHDVMRSADTSRVLTLKEADPIKTVAEANSSRHVPGPDAVALVLLC